MAEYDIHFADELAIAAAGVSAVGLTSVAQERVRLYLALLSLELSLKAMLERAGLPVSTIRSRSHSIKDLLADLTKCTIEAEIANEVWQRVSASRLRAVTIRSGAEEGTVGQMIDRMENNVSVYPNQIRYGAFLRHFASEVVVDAARKTNDFGKTFWSSLQLNDA